MYRLLVTHPNGAKSALYPTTIQDVAYFLDTLTEQGFPAPEIERKNIVYSTLSPAEEEFLTVYMTETALGRINEGD